MNWSAATRRCLRRASAIRAPSTPPRRPRRGRRRIFFVMQELELMVDVLPWAPDHPPCSGGAVGGVLQHMHGGDALDMSADLACGFDAPTGEVLAARCTTATRCRSPVRDGRDGYPAQQRAATGSSRQFSGCSTRGSGPMATSMARGAQATVARAVRTRAARRPKGGPGSFLRPLDTAIAVRLASALQRAARGDLNRENRGRWRRAAALEARAAGRGLCAT